MNPIARLLPNLGNPLAEPVETDEERLAREKQERRDFHWGRVRNGPVKFSTISVGQQRRAMKRLATSAERKTNKRHRRNFISNQHKLFVVRGHLQAIGVVPYVTDYRPGIAQQVRSSQWLVQNFGQRYERDTSDESGFHLSGELILHENILAESVQRAAAAVGIKLEVSA